jgi:pimeloyl-ACP methyl ester carboxylesterase
MERRIGPLRAEVVDPESAQFTAPVLLLHGLWSSPVIWRPFTGYLAHRGWLSIAPHLQLAEPDKASLAAYEGAVCGLIKGLPAPPVIIGHDFGAVIGLRLVGVAVAVVALAPLVLPPLAPVPRALRDAGSWFTRVTKAEQPLRAPRRGWRSSYPPSDNPHREPARLIRALADGPSRYRGTKFRLVMAGRTIRHLPAGRTLRGLPGRDPWNSAQVTRCPSKALGTNVYQLFTADRPHGGNRWQLFDEASE